MKYNVSVFARGIINYEIEADNLAQAKQVGEDWSRQEHIYNFDYMNVDAEANQISNI